MQTKIKLKNDEKLFFVVESLHRVQEFCKLKIIPTRYNDTMITEGITDVNNSMRVPLVYVIRGIDSCLQCHTTIIELNKYGEEIKTL